MKKVLKVLGILVLAVVVGAVAGLSMYGVTKLTGVLDTYKVAVRKDGFGVDIEKKEPKPAEEKKSETKIGADAGETRVVYTSAADVSALVEESMPSVVSITGKTEYESYNMYGFFFGYGEKQTYEGESAGSGIIIGEDDDEYMIATNNHVVADTKELVITFADGKTAEAKIKGREADDDVAVISVKKADIDDETEKKIAVAKIGDSDKLKVGEGVIAIGNALGQGLSVTQGIVSALDRTIEAQGGTGKGLIQTDAAINPGNSGGALLNMAGELVGINEAKYSSTEVEGMGFAIPINSVLELLEDFSEREIREAVDEDEQGYIGIQGQTIDSEMAQSYDMPEGVYVYKIVEGAPAENSGLREKDIITKFDGQSVDSMEDLQEVLKGYKAGEKIRITVERLVDSEYTEQELELELAPKDKLE